MTYNVSSGTLSLYTTTTTYVLRCKYRVIKRYKVVSKLLNWKSAQKYCEKYQRHLLSIRNEAEQAKLISYFSNLPR